MFEKLKKRWNITSNTQLTVILIVFAITGSLSAKLAKPVCDYFGIMPDSFHPVLYWTIRLLIILPVYQVLLILIGTLFGQFRFFWEFEKKMLGIRKKKTESIPEN
ncbi:MAG: diacylglyceryl transferase [Capnocytophaga sp.]|nr:diacylglyceryl transferase [Capnocytophaga sp.]